jgi:hypothetical protein
VSSLIRSLDDAPVRAQATVALISRVQRPYLFRVRVEGQFPHNKVREYDIAGVNEAAVAFEGIRIFERQMSKAVVIRDLIMDSIRPRGG